MGVHQMEYYVYFEDEDSMSDQTYSKDELVQLNSFDPETKVCLEGKDNWLEAREIEDLKEVFQESQEKLSRPSEPAASSPDEGKSFQEQTKDKAKEVSEKAREVSEQVLDEEQVEKAQEMGKEAVSTAREATGNAWQAIKLIFTDPMGGQSESINMLGKGGALSAGIALCVLFMLVTNLYGFKIYSLQSNMAQQLGQFSDKAGSPSLIGILFKVSFAALTPIGGIFGGYFLIGNFVSDTEVGLPEYFLMTGVTLLPMDILGVIAYFLGIANYELIGLLSFFAVTLTILLINGSFLDVMKLSTRKAFFLTPVLILISAYITSVIVRSFFNFGF